ncbi:hypothetical protein SAMN06298212_102153 [Ruaniaceae bacterium KH17]|nr:hypothetical protein SAMN06298212_102153 [Ruaniaceae bacterium KH17]
MLIWLPPSEGKTAPESGPALELESLVLPELSDARSEAMSALRALGDGDEAAQVLGLGRKSAADAALNVTLDTAPCAPAIALYTGVLYDHLDADSLDHRARARLDEHVWIASGLFGLVRPSDLIPNHRLAMGVKLPPLGNLASWWRPRLARALPDLAGRTIVDCRSGAYRAAYLAAESHVLEIAVVEERAAGRKVITHMAKKWRGLAVRHLIRSPEPGECSSREDVIDALRGLTERPEIIAVEIGDRQLARAGGSTTRVTLVTESTEI